MSRSLLNLFGLALTWGVWFWLASWTLSPLDSLIVAAASLLLLVPLFLAEGWLLNRRQIKQAGWAAALVNFFILVFLGSAILQAIQLGLASSAWQLLLWPEAGLALLFLILLLALLGMKARRVVSATRFVFADWLCLCNRNPIILSLLAFLLGVGLWLQSAFFLVCLLVVISPALLVLLAQVEEYELRTRQAS